MIFHHLFCPKKPASLLKNLLPREEAEVKLEFDDKNAFFTLTGFKLVCRLVEGKYPAIILYPIE